MGKKSNDKRIKADENVCFCCIMKEQTAPEVVYVKGNGYGIFGPVQEKE